MPVLTSYAVDNDRSFRTALEKAKALAEDMRRPLELVSKDFFKSQDGLWNTSGAGRYPDLTTRYKIQKENRWGFIYPLLEASGALRRSLTNPSDSNAVAEIVNRDTLVMGTKLPYARAVQSKRKFLFIGPEAQKFATTAHMGRVDRWKKIFRDHLLEGLGAPGADPKTFDVK